MNRHINTLLATACALVLLAASCATPKKVVYLQDMANDSQIQMENEIEAIVVPYDELDIIISCPNPEIARPFNLRTALTGNANAAVGGGSSYTYIVDPSGYIQIPILGEVKAAGLTRLQLQDKICRLLTDGGYLMDPYVNVRFYNFKIFFLGSDGGKSITISNERCTFLEALALSGDISAYTRRDKIGVLREVDGKMTIHYMDPRSSKIFNDPFFTLEKNDIIITQSYASKYWRDEMSFWTSWISIGSSLSTLATTALLLVKTLDKNEE